MATHLVGLHRPANLRLRRAVAFRSVAERDAHPPDGVRDDERRRQARVPCNGGAPPRRGADCEACARFLGWDDDGERLSLRCAWSDRDRVRDRMTVAGALVVTSPLTACVDAALLARRHQVRRLLVVDGLRLVGVVSRRELRAGGRVVDRMSRDVFAVLADATLGEALAAMLALDIGLLPVVGERFVIGVITRGDLRRVGVPQQQLRPPRLTLSEAVQLAEPPAGKSPSTTEPRPPADDDELRARADAPSLAPRADDDSDLVELADDTLP